MANQDYGELFCQAVDEIVKKRLEGISYDTTILCTIVDDSTRDKGIYTVSNGSAKFDAVSAITSYRNNDNVYIQIPGGDMNEQKIIIGKKTDKTETSYIYQRPFSTLVDITGNLISSNIDSNETGLRANAYTQGFTDPYNDRQQAITLWTYNAYDEQALRNEEGSAHLAYTRLGIQGSFQSWLNPFYADLEDKTAANQPRYVIKGDYGLRLRVYTVDETVSTDITGKSAYYDMYLSCADMNGNPYNFQTFYQQEKVFDISSIGSIQKMELQFYQDAGSFIDIDGNEIPFTDFLGNYIAPNLYLKDPYITLGYDISEFDEEMVTIYTLDSTTYSATAQPLPNNHKEIQLRWIHKLDDGTFMSVDDKTKFDYEVRWYRYELGHSSADEYSGVYWKDLSKQISVDAKHSYEILDQQWLIENNKNGQEYQRKPSFFSTWLLPDITLQNEQIKAIIIYNGKPYHSNILKCENEREVVNKATVDAVQALSINCADNTYGNYRIYNQGNSLIDYAQAQVIREWVPYFSSATGTGDNIATPLVEAESIEWIIPTEKTMIIIDDGFKGGDCEISQDTDKRLHIKRYGAGIASNELDGLNTQKYRIRSYYSQTYSDNTIQCKIVKNNTTYTATKELTFGVAGTTGTDCTFILDFDNGVTAITNNGSSAVTVTARLYDYENKEIDLSGRTIKWGWKTSDGLLTQVATDKNYQIEIKKTSITTLNTNYNILQASMAWGDTTLYAYLPIPIRASDEYAYISGTTQVIYNSAGEILDYFKNPYAIYNISAEEINPSAISWEVINNNTKEDGVYSPQITTGRDGLEYLTPLSFYVEGACEKVCVVAKHGSTVVWVQPLLIMQNKYPSSMINKWEGSLDVGTTDPGTILAPRLVAGMKHSEDNTFSGVVLGNWGDQDADNSLTSGETGLYGFDHGEQSYAFKQDGTAFIGKSGKGRIYFNGEDGRIYSSTWTGTAPKGMVIDLDDGIIEMQSPTNATTAGSIRIDATAAEKVLTIGNKFWVKWDGTLHAQEGEFEGKIDADEGDIGAWKINEYGLFAGGTKENNYDDATAKLYASGILKMGSSWGSTTIDSTGISMGTGAGAIFIGEGTITMGNRKAWNKIVIDTTSGVTIGTGYGQIQISDGSIRLGDGTMSSYWSQTGIRLGTFADSTYINANGMYAKTVNIYSDISTGSDNTGVAGTSAGSIKYVTANYGGSNSLTGSPGIGITSGNQVLKVTSAHIGATNGSATWVIDKDGFAAMHHTGGRLYLKSDMAHMYYTDSNYIKITESGVEIKPNITTTTLTTTNLTVNGGKVSGIYATLV